MDLFSHLFKMLAVVTDEMGNTQRTPPSFYAFLSFLLPSITQAFTVLVALSTTSSLAKARASAFLRTCAVQQEMNHSEWRCSTLSPLNLRTRDM